MSLVAEERGDSWSSVPLVRAIFADPPMVCDEEDFGPVAIEEQPHKNASNAIRVHEQILPSIRFNCNRQAGAMFLRLDAQRTVLFAKFCTEKRGMGVERSCYEPFLEW